MSKSEVEQYQLLTTHTADTDLVPRSLSIKQHGIASCRKVCLVRFEKVLRF